MAEPTAYLVKAMPFNKGKVFAQDTRMDKALHFTTYFVDLFLVSNAATTKIRMAQLINIFRGKEDYLL